MGCVYRATNTVNGKMYIGKTKNTLEERRVGHLTASNKKKSIFQKALKKYGKDSFKWDVLYESDDENDLYEKEKFYIAQMNSYMPNGYNMTTGGDGHYGRCFTSKWRDSNYKRAEDCGVPCYCVELNKVYRTGAEAYRDTGVSTNTIRALCKEPFRKSFKYHFCNAKEVEIRILQDAYMNNELQYGKHLTDENRKNMSIAQKNRVLPEETLNKLREEKRKYMLSDKNPFRGKHITPDMLEKRRTTMLNNGTSPKGKNNPSARAVINLSDGKTFDTMKEASEFYKLPPKSYSNICSACKGTIKSAYGYKWAYYNKDHKGDTE